MNQFRTTRLINTCPIEYIKLLQQMLFIDLYNDTLVNRLRIAWSHTEKQLIYLNDECFFFEVFTRFNSEFEFSWKYIITLASVLRQQPTQRVIKTFNAASFNKRIHLAASSELLAPNYKKIRNVNHESIKWNFLP